MLEDKLAHISRLRRLRRLARLMDTVKAKKQAVDDDDDDIEPVRKKKSSVSRLLIKRRLADLRRRLAKIDDVDWFGTERPHITTDTYSTGYDYGKEYNPDMPWKKDRDRRDPETGRIKSEFEQKLPLKVNISVGSLRRLAQKRRTVAFLKALKISKRLFDTNTATYRKIAESLATMDPDALDRIYRYVMAAKQAKNKDEEPEDSDAEYTDLSENADIDNEDIDNEDIDNEDIDIADGGEGGGQAGAEEGEDSGTTEMPDLTDDGGNYAELATVPLETTEEGEIPEQFISDETAGTDQEVGAELGEGAPAEKTDKDGEVVLNFEEGGEQETVEISKEVSDLIKKIIETPVSAKAKVRKRSRAQIDRVIRQASLNVDNDLVSNLSKIWSRAPKFDKNL